MEPVHHRISAGWYSWPRGLLVLASGPAPVAAVGATALLGFGFSFPWSSIASTVLRRTPSSERGSAVGILSAFLRSFRRVEFLRCWLGGARVWVFRRVLHGRAWRSLPAAIAGKVRVFHPDEGARSRFVGSR
jgi:hypothetical protein